MPERLDEAGGDLIDDLALTLGEAVDEVRRESRNVFG
jgi:hypothetical protein